MILITGGLGYIGSHVAATLAEKSDIVILDNLCNSNISALTTLRHLYPTTAFHFYQGDIRDPVILHRIFEDHPIATVIHMAALKSVKDSFAQREEYESVNVGGTKILLEAMEAAGCTRIVFSSSATVYGQAAPPLSETTKAGIGITNPYGETKWTVEQLLQTRAPTIRSVILRYFNPVGAHPTHLLGEAPSGTPNNVLPVLIRSLHEAVPMTVFGDDWPTRDGTCARDFIDIQDLAAAHACAVARFDTLVEQENPWVCNIGTGRGTTVLELVGCFESVNGIQVPYTLGPRREGDLDEVFAAINPARLALLGWTPQQTLETSCFNSWQFSLRCNRSKDNH
jgi:UDP-glucose 4-epimerase